MSQKDDTSPLGTTEPAWWIRIIRPALRFLSRSIIMGVGAIITYVGLAQMPTISGFDSFGLVLEAGIGLGIVRFGWTAPSSIIDRYT